MFLDQESQLIADWLTPVDYGSQQSDYIGRRQPGTGQWLLESAAYQEWLEGQKQTLFCPGIPGAGKTIITSIVIEELTTHFQFDKKVGIAYLYLNFRQQDDQKAKDLLASLLKQLTVHRSSLSRAVKELHERHKKPRTRPSFDEISKALHSISTEYSRVFIVIDALDECKSVDGCRTRFLSEIFSLQAKQGVNVFATSRFIPEITEKFDKGSPIEIRASDEDVQKYLDGQMFILPGFVDRSPALQEEIKTAIIKAVDGMFLLAQLHLKSLVGKTSPKKVRDALKKLPTGSEAYDYAYQNAMERIERQAVDEKELAMQVLSWIVCAKRPLKTTELQHALAVEIDEPELDEENFPEIENMVSICAGLVTVDEDSEIIRLVHYTTQEYFERTQKDWFVNAESDITIICVTYLSFRVFESGYCQTDEEFEERLRSNWLYDYAAHNWGHHASKALTLCQQVVDFLESELKIQAASQALLATKWYSSHFEYSQEVPRQITGPHLAAYFGLKEAMTTLLGNGHDLNSRDSYGQTPLLWAAEKGHEAIVKLLIIHSNGNGNSEPAEPAGSETKERGGDETLAKTQTK
ncbi:hypothetical protein BDZ45DRAFT_705761 [Acephala macrosclerotiorum]|nr:hypothetical protein BDZ45DRAFT_705761 [Acephala macrosclerotiorum]